MNHKAILSCLLYQKMQKQYDETDYLLWSVQLELQINQSIAKEPMPNYELHLQRKEWNKIRFFIQLKRITKLSFVNVRSPSTV